MYIYCPIKEFSSWHVKNATRAKGKGRGSDKQKMDNEAYETIFVEEGEKIHKKPLANNGNKNLYIILRNDVWEE